MKKIRTAFIRKLYTNGMAPKKQGTLWGGIPSLQ